MIGQAIPVFWKKISPILGLIHLTCTNNLFGNPQWSLFLKCKLIYDEINNQLTNLIGYGWCQNQKNKLKIVGGAMSWSNQQLYVYTMYVLILDDSG